MLRVYIPGGVAVYRNYARAVRRAGAVPCFTDDPADCGCLLLPGGGDLSPMLSMDRPILPAAALTRRRTRWKWIC